MINTYHIKHVRGHYEMYDIYGNFIVSGDSEHETYNSYLELIKDQYCRNKTA